MTSAFTNLFMKESDIPEKYHKPLMNGSTWLLNGELKTWTGPSTKVYSPILDENGNKFEIGNYPSMTKDEALQALDSAHKAFNHGSGLWPTMSTKARIECVEKYLVGLASRKAEIVNLIMWEICKSEADATKEVDRTIDYIKDTIAELKDLENRGLQFTRTGGVLAQIRRVPLGVTLILGPFNYPFNETYTNLFPALLMGNTVILKTPRTGCMCHIPTLELFKTCFPPGVVNVIHGAGRETLPHIMETGKIDVFAFIGTNKAAEDLQKLHPHPSRLRVCLGLDAKNPGIVMEDADLNVAVTECVLGSLSYNGQRCTALKVLYVHKSIAAEFVSRFSKKVDELKIGLPWDKGVNITPLPEPHKPAYLKEVIEDATKKGAKITNERGGQMDRTFVFPTVLYPVTKEMRCYDEEQFGPLVPIVEFESFDEIKKALQDSSYGQQASIFSESPHKLSPFIDFLVNQVSRVNINSQCQRGPDVLPFTGRKNSACGTLSIPDALRVFSIRSIMAAKDNAENQKIISDIMNEKMSNYLRSEYLF